MFLFALTRQVRPNKTTYVVSLLAAFLFALTRQVRPNKTTYVVSLLAAFLFALTRQVRPNRVDHDRHSIRPHRFYSL